MFDTNHFKEKIKAWTQENPDASKDEFLNYCEELIPVGKYKQFSWLLEQASMWFENIRRNAKNLSAD